MKLPRYALTGLVGLTLIAACGVGQAEVIPLFTEIVDPAIWNAKIETDTPSNQNVAVSAPTPFGTGDALRMLDVANDDKPELQGELAAALTGPFQINVQAFNQSGNDSSRAIRMRLANSGDSITSESRAAFSLSWQADGEFNAKYSGLADLDPNDVDTLSSDPLVGVHSVSMVANGAVSGTYTYNLFGVSRTLNPTSYDVYLDGVLFNDSTDPDFINGMLFTLGKSAGNYDPALGLQRVGIVSSGDSHVDPDVLFDNWDIRTGSDMIPEPATFGLLLGALIGLGCLRRRR